MSLFSNTYRTCQVPKNLSFDEASLFWRLRLGEGLPSRKWHKPKDRTKTWHEIKHTLDQKVKKTAQASKIIQKPKQPFFKNLLKKSIKLFKNAYLFCD